MGFFFLDILIFLVILSLFCKVRDLGLFEWDALRGRNPPKKATPIYMRHPVHVLKTPPGLTDIVMGRTPHAPLLSLECPTPTLYSEDIKKYEREDCIKDPPRIERVSFRDSLEFIGKLADGKYSYTMLVRRKEDDREFAAKLFKKICRKDHQAFEDLGVQHDYDVLHRLPVQQNIVRIYGYDDSRIKSANIKEEGVPDLLFEYLPNTVDHTVQHLRHWGMRIHPLDLKHIMRSIFAALRHLKRNNVLHRGICIDSIYLTGRSVVRLGDFHECSAFERS
jgi:hypothetical protein